MIETEKKIAENLALIREINDKCNGSETKNNIGIMIDTIVETLEITNARISNLTLSLLVGVGGEEAVKKYYNLK